MRPNHRRRGVSYANFLLAQQLLQEFNNGGIPPVTLLTIVFQILTYFGAFWNLSPLESCLSFNKIFRYKDYKKILISQIEHGDDWHLYYNMISFLNKGKHLEVRMGQTKYILTLILFTILTPLVYIGLNYALAETLQDYSYYDRCAVGFSGVIFALKVLTTQDMINQGPVPVRIFGIPIGSSLSAKYSVWIELILISLITPNASFVGHLAGILVGLAFVHGPLKYLIEILHGFLFEFNTAGRSSRFTQAPQPTGYRNQE